MIGRGNRYRAWCLPWLLGACSVADFPAPLGDQPDASVVLDAAAVDATAPSDAWDGGPPTVDAATRVDAGFNEVDAATVNPADAGVDGVTVDVARTSAGDFAGALDLPSFRHALPGAAQALAVGPRLAVTVNPDSDSVTIVDATTLQVQREIPVGDEPRTIAVTSDERHALVTNFRDGTLSVLDLDAGRELFYIDVGAMPWGVALTGGHAYVALFARGELAVVDLASRTVEQRLPLGPFPAGVARCATGCPTPDTLLVTHLYSGRLSFVDLDPLALRTSLATGADTNLSAFVLIAGTRAYLPQTRSNADNPNRQFDTTVFPVVNVVDLTKPALVNAARLTLDTTDRPVALPMSVAVDPRTNAVWVANASSNDLSVIAPAPVQRRLAHIDGGAFPTALAFTTDGRQVLVNETLDGTLAAYDAQTFTLVKRVAVTTLPLAPDLLLGKRLFHDARRATLAKDRWMSCATCHLDGFHDARTWLSFPDGPRNTTALFNLEETRPLHWSGDLDEVQDVEATVRFIQAGTGLHPAPQIDTLGAPLADGSPELEALSRYLRTLRPPPSPWQDDHAAIGRGQAQFDRLGCASCHAGPHFTDRKNHDVGTGVAAVERNSHGRGTTYDTPSLRALWLTAPYLHDGSAPTMEDLFKRGPAHDVTTRTTADQLADLISYLRSL